MFPVNLLTIFYSAPSITISDTTVPVLTEKPIISKDDSDLADKLEKEVIKLCFPVDLFSPHYCITISF